MADTALASSEPGAAVAGKEAALAAPVASEPSAAAGAAEPAQPCAHAQPLAAAQHAGPAAANAAPAAPASGAAAATAGAVQPCARAQPWASSKDAASGAAARAANRLALLVAATDAPLVAPRPAPTTVSALLLAQPSAAAVSLGQEQRRQQHLPQLPRDEHVLTLTPEVPVLACDQLVRKLPPPPALESAASLDQAHASTMLLSWPLGNAQLTLAGSVSTRSDDGHICSCRVRRLWQACSQAPQSTRSTRPECSKVSQSLPSAA